MVFLIILLFWIILTVFTVQNDLPVDGYLKVGFPFRFFQSYQPECAYCPLKSELNYLMLFLDISLLILVTFIIALIKKQVKNWKIKK